MILPQQLEQSSLLDSVVDAAQGSRLSLCEHSLLQQCWDVGEDVRLRDDARLRRTPWGRWILAEHFLANDLANERLRQDAGTEQSLDHLCAELDVTAGRHCVLCSGDPRFIIRNGTVRLAATELSRRPIVEDATELERFKTHLPLYALKTAAAFVLTDKRKAPVQQQSAEVLGWVQVTIPGRELNASMFVTEIQDDGLDDGTTRLSNGAFAVFEFWPKEPWQGKIVIVRGSFTVPDTGNYAVRKYQPETDLTDIAIRQVALVSLNPDKRRYPDIVLQPDREHDLTVVASLITALSLDQYKRRPKSLVPRGRRDLSSEEGQTRIAERLAKAARKIFDGLAEGEEDSEATDGKSGPAARFVCLDSECGGLHIETSPLKQLPPFVKKLQISTGGQAITVLASNLRNRVWRSAVPASTYGYSWSAPGFEDELDEELLQLKLNGLNNDEASVFRIDAAGIGHHVVGAAISPGQSLRILIPPGLASVELPQVQTSALNGEWRLWECDLSGSLTSELRDTLERLGLQLGKSAPSVQWVVVPPVAYVESASGDTYPSFDTETAPTLQIEGVKTTVEGELSIFLLVGSQLVAKPLPPGESWILQLSDLPAGQYVLEVIHRRTRFESVRVPFMLGSEYEKTIQAQLEFRVGGKSVPIQPTGVACCEDDFTHLGDGIELQVMGPPLWSYRSTWFADTGKSYGTTSLSESGELDWEELSNRTLEARQRNTIGNLVLDFDELGCLELRHTRRADPERLRKEVIQLIREKAASIEAMNGQFQLLRGMWIHPLLERLGYRVRELDQDALAKAPSGTTAILLDESVRNESQISIGLKAPLVITTANVDWNSLDEGSVLAFAESLCKQFKALEAFVTDGLRWTRHRRGKRVHPEVCDLREIANDDDSASFEHFLFDFAAGV